MSEKWVGLPLKQIYHNDNQVIVSKSKIVR